jgi:hypothetical protein
VSTRFWPKIDLPKIDLPKIDLPKIDLPKIDLPKIDLPKIDLPKIAHIHYIYPDETSIQQIVSIHGTLFQALLLASPVSFQSLHADL